METKFKNTDVVKFKRNSTQKQDITVIAGVVEKTLELQNQSYVIEYTNGWTPNEIRIRQYELDINKKYLYAVENELTLIT